MSLASGTKLGPYEIQAPLGAGGMGEVYRARDTRLDRDVAIKVLPASLSSDASLKQRLEREAKAVSKLSHPHICTLHDVGHQDGVDFLVMEYLEGETLERRLSKGPLPLAVFEDVIGADDAKALAAVVRITEQWHDSSAALLIEMVHRVRSRLVLASVIVLIESVSGVEFRTGASDDVVDA